MCRSRGPQKRAATLDPRTLLLEVPTGMLRTSVTPGSSWPVLVWESFVIAIWWMLRHAELAALTVEALLIFTDTQEAELRLGVTKTDVAGRGCRRRFACCCREGIPPLLCPFHVAHRVAAQAALRQARATDLLFCTALGCPPTRSGTLEAWRALVPKAIVQDDLGGQTAAPLSGHSPRQIGAQWLSALGLLPDQVMFIGRWGSAAVERYIASSRVHIASRWSRIAAKGFSSSVVSGASVALDDGRSFRHVRTLVGSLRRDVDSLIGSALSDPGKGIRSIAGARPAFIVNLNSGICHRTRCSPAVTLTCDWSSSCGWKFGRALVEWRSLEPVGGLCRRLERFPLAVDPEGADSSDCSSGYNQSSSDEST